MATIQNARDTLLQAMSPRVAAVTLAAVGLVANLADASQVINNLPDYTRVSGVTALATQAALSYGGTYLNGFGQLAPLSSVDLSSAYASGNLPGYTRVTGVTNIVTQSTLSLGGSFLTGFGAVASQNALSLGGGYLTGFGTIAGQSSLALGSSYLTGFGAIAGQSSLAYGGAYLSGFGQLAPLSSIDLSTSYAVGNLSAARIAAGTLAAGVIYAGQITGTQITANSITVDKLQSGTSILSNTNLRFVLNGAPLVGYGDCAVGGISISEANIAGVFSNINQIGGIGLVGASACQSDNGFAFAGLGGFVNSPRTKALLGGGNTAGIFQNVVTSTQVNLATSTYAIEIVSGQIRYGGVTIQPPTGNASHSLRGNGTWA